MIKNKAIEKYSRNCFDNVFRTETSKPGFFCLDLGQNLNSYTLREIMVILKKHLSGQAYNHFNKSLNYQWLGRFDQQENTKFHLDNASNQSFLMLGYEPTEIESELYIADYVKFSIDQGIDPAEYFNKFNPIFADNEDVLKPYITRISPFDERSFKIVLINNSNCQSECETLGVLHKAKIKKVNLDKSRIVNSMMLELVSNKNTGKQYAIENEFLNTTQIST